VTISADRSLAEIVSGAATRLVAAGLAEDDARRDAALLARRVLGWDSARWLAHNVEAAPPTFDSAFEPLVQRRIQREPVAYIFGEREFYGRRLIVTRDVLIPRPETELLIETAIRVLDRMRVADIRVPRILDVGVGSGCIAVTLALEWPSATIVATDLSPAALSVAERNAFAHGVAHRVALTLANHARDSWHPFDLIVSNPPYVPERDRATLAPEVACYEPALALFAGDDGLDLIRRLIPDAARLLTPAGSLIVEIGAGQATAVRRIAAEHFANITFERDLQNIERVLVAHR